MHSSRNRKVEILNEHLQFMLAGTMPHTRSRHNSFCLWTLEVCFPVRLSPKHQSIKMAQFPEVIEQNNLNKVISLGRTSSICHTMNWVAQRGSGSLVTTVDVPWGCWVSWFPSIYPTVQEAHFLWCPQIHLNFNGSHLSSDLYFNMPPEFLLWLILVYFRHCPYGLLLKHTYNPST